MKIPIETGRWRNIPIETGRWRNIPTETGRWRNIPIEERICNMGHYQNTHTFLLPCD